MKNDGQNFEELINHVEVNSSKIILHKIFRIWIIFRREKLKHQELKQMIRMKREVQNLVLKNGRLSSVEKHSNAFKKESF